MMFSCTMGFGADAWSRLFPEQGKPKELKTFEEIKGEKHTAVSTRATYCFTSVQNRWDYVLSLHLSSMRNFKAWLNLSTKLTVSDIWMARHYRLCGWNGESGG